MSEIVPLLPELDDDELDVVRAREEGGKARAGIIGKIDELLGEAPAPAKKPATKKPAAKKPAAKKADAFPIANYDALTVADVGKRLKKLDADALNEVRAYEKKHKGRKGVLDKVDAELSSR